MTAPTDTYTRPQSELRCEDTDETTQAQQMAARFGGDGQQWQDDDGVELDDALGAADAVLMTRDDPAWRHQLPDGSAIIVTDGAWDLGIPSTETDDRRECTCWSEDGVTCREPDNCPCRCHRA